ncbi:MAG: DUF1571 domain-containing protein [Isosphaeraceae bacterium]
MAATRFRMAAVLRSARRTWWAFPLLLIPTGFVLACLWLTAPLNEGGSVPPPDVVAIAFKNPVVRLPTGVDAPDSAKPVPVWPDTRIEGAPAKVLLLDALLHAADRLNRVSAYTATFSKQERIGNKLGPVQTLELKVRHRPFAIYLKFLSPVAGKEVVYAEGLHDNKMIAHGGGLARFLVPRLAVAPDHPIALKDSRHAVTEAGLANLAAKLIAYRRMDLDDEEAVTILDRVTDAKGRPRLRSLHTHSDPTANRPFTRVEVLYEPETFFPVQIHSYDWPAPGKGGDLLLAEFYAYEDLVLDAPLTTIDFDPANPSYAFHRY